jgi:hypothetical protein
MSPKVTKGCLCFGMEIQDNQITALPAMSQKGAAAKAV